MFKTVVWATDGSETADRAFPFAKALVSDSGGSLVVAHSKERLMGGRSTGEPVLADEDELEAKIQGQVADAKKEGFDATFRLMSGSSGHAAHMIADIADEVGADLIVVGTRGHTAVGGLLLGSVTQRLLHIASCPVLAVPPGAQPPTKA